MATPRLLISGLSGGSGKTTISLGLARYFANNPSPETNQTTCSPPIARPPLSSTCDAMTAVPGQCPSSSSDHAQHQIHPDKLSLIQDRFKPEQTFFHMPANGARQSLTHLSYAPRPVQTFKKGPDYIDAVWLGLAGNCITKTLDPYFAPPSMLQALFVNGSANASCSIIEGNRGLFDGVDISGSCSSAQLAKILQTKVLLAVDCTKMTRTVAALILGCTEFDKELTIGGVILNRLGTERQETIIRDAIAHYTDVPVLGALPRLHSPLLPERSLGLCAITRESTGYIDRISDFVTKHLDMAAIQALMNSHTDILPLDQPGQDISAHEYPPATGLRSLSPEVTANRHSSASPVAEVSENQTHTAAAVHTHGTQAPVDATRESFQPSAGQQPDQRTKPAIGYIYDEAIWFYYAENLEALEQEGAQLIRLSLFSAASWDCIDGIYIGGGQIEHCAARISNSPQLHLLASFAANGMPVYIEGAGLALACKTLAIGDISYPMAGIFDATLTLADRPCALGYTKAVVTQSTPFFVKEQSVTGHEFHFFKYSAPSQLPTYFELAKGKGLFASSDTENGKKHLDGLVYNNVCASFMHIFAPATPVWAANFSSLARAYHHKKAHISIAASHDKA